MQFHLFEYEMSREFVRGKSWGHEPRPNPYSGLLSCFPMLGWAKWVGKVDCTLLTFFIFISRFREKKKLRVCGAEVEWTLQKGDGGFEFAIKIIAYHSLSPSFSPLKSIIFLVSPLCHFRFMWMVNSCHIDQTPS